MTFHPLGSTPSEPVTYEKRDILTGTKEVIVDRDAMIALNKDNISLLRDIRKLLNLGIPAAQLIAYPQGATVNNGGPVDIYFMGDGSRRHATLVAISGSADFYYDFDRPASTNSPKYVFSVQNGGALWIAGIEVERISVLGGSGTSLYINNFTTGAAPNTNYIAVRSWGPTPYRDDISYQS